MKAMTTLLAAGSLALFAVSAASAAPCNTGQQAMNKDKSSQVDPPATGNVSPGSKAESPGTVGAMNNAGGSKATSPSDVSKQSKGEPTAAQKADGC